MRLKDWSKGLLAFGLFSLLLTGCGNAGETQESETAVDKKVTVNIFQSKIEFQKQFEQAFTEFNKIHPEIELKLQSTGGTSDYATTLKSMVSSGTEPTIFNIAGPNDLETWGDRLTDLSDMKAADLAMEGTLDGVTIDGKVLGIPYNIEGNGTIYNKEIFEKAGVDPDSIQTLDDLEEAAKTIDSKKDELGIEAAMAFGAKDAWIIQHTLSAFLAPEFDNNLLTAYEAKEVNFKYGDQLKHYLDILNKYSVQPINSVDFSQQVEQLFSLGKVAMIQQGNWAYTAISAIDQEFADEKIGMLPLPVDGVAEGSISVGVPNYWAVNSKASDEEIKAAKTFLDWYYTSDEGKEMILSDFNYIPAYEGYDVDKIADPVSQDVYKYFSEGKATSWVFSSFPNGWNDTTAAAEIQRYLGGESDWKSVIEKSEKAWKEERAE